MKGFKSLLLLCGVIGIFASEHARVLAQNGSSRAYDQERKVSPMVQLTTTVVSQFYCTQVVEQDREVQLRVKLKLILRNVSTDTLIIDRYGGWISGVALSKSLAKAQAKRYVYHPHNYFRPLYKFVHREFPEAAPTDEFHILSPNESWEYEYEDEQWISVTDSSQPAQNLRSANYFLEVVAQTWSFEREMAEDLRKRWAKYGYFWFDSVKSFPMPLKINKPSKVLPICQR